MKRLYLRVRVTRLPPSDLMPTRGRVVDVKSGRDISGRVPLVYADELLAARPGDKIDVFLWDDPPRIRYRRHRREQAQLREYPARLRVAERTA